MSLLTRFCLFRAPEYLFTEENEPKPNKLISQFPVPIAADVVD